MTAIRPFQTQRPSRGFGSTALLFAVLLSLALGASSSAWADSRHAANRPINDAVRRALRNAPEIGVVVVDVESGETVYSYRGDRSLILASNTKLLTSAAALDRLGPGFFFETPVLARGTLAAGRLDGDLAVVGRGDPNISGRHWEGDVFAVFRRWADQLRARGIREVGGDLIFVDGYFDGPWVHPDWPKDQLDRWYEAPVAALSFNDNSVLVRVQTGASGERPRVETLPRLGFMPVRNSARTATVRGERLRIGRQPSASEIEVSGIMAPGASEREHFVSVKDPVAYFASAFRSVLAEEGISVAGRSLVAGDLPQGSWRQAAAFRSDLLTTLSVVNKRSQNFYAESVLKTLGAEVCNEGSWDTGLKVMADFLEELGIARGSYTMADGSGMSRNNRFTPRQMTLLLRYMHQHRFSHDFLRSLPFSGEPQGSWRKRLATAPYRGNVFAKTGTLRRVSALSGYAKGRSGRTYAFSILGNSVRRSSTAKADQDRIVRALIDNG